MNTKQLILVAIAAATGAALAAVPEVSNVTMTQAANRLVTITYQLTEAAVVTLDIQTNANTSAAANDPGWTTIGGEAVCNARGDVWKQVSGKATYTITWQPDQSWKGPDENGFKIAANGARARVTAWPLDNTPDYMAVDVSAAAQPNTQTYYPAADFVPGGVTNSIYKTTKLLMRKIMAKDVEWTMGSTTLEKDYLRKAEREATHQVTLTNNYYIGVYEVTQSQWSQVATNSDFLAKFSTERPMRPMGVSYNRMRHSVANSSDTSYYYPADPNPSSFLGLLRSKTGIDFDLPSEAQWEFAARAGKGVGYWNDGSDIQGKNQDANLDLLGRYKYNGGMVLNGTNYAEPADDCGVTNGTAIVGSYTPNGWGLYDMHGNVWELCLDLFVNDISALNGAVNTESGSERVARGGSYNSEAGNVRPAYRASYAPTYSGAGYGFRVACTAGLE